MYVDENVMSSFWWCSTDQRHALHRKAEALPCLAQRVDVARCLLAEGEVLPHHHFDDVEAFDEQLMDVAVRGELHEVGGERHHQEHVDTQFLDELGAAGQRGQLRRMAAGEHDFHRVRVERHQHGRHAAGPAGLDGVTDQLLVPAMHTVEHADRNDASTPVRRDVVLSPPALHSRKPTAQGVARLR